MTVKNQRKGLIVIYRQEIIQDVTIFTSQPVSKFYNTLFLNLDLSDIPEYPHTGRKGFSNHSMICAFIVMKCEGFSMISDLVDYLNNNLIIAHFCGFNIFKPLPSYWTFDRFLKNFNHEFLSSIMHSQILSLFENGVLDTSFIGLDSTPVSANTSFNNPKSFSINKFQKDNQPKSDKDCKLGVHSASNQFNEKKFEFFWGYKNHVLVDCISGLPIFELTTTADVADCSVALDILAKTNDFISIRNCSFLADKGYDSKDIYNKVSELYDGDCFIPLNSRNSKSHSSLPSGRLICDAGLPMFKDGKTFDYSNNRVRQKFSCPLKFSKSHSCPCNNPKFFNGKKNRGCTKYITIPNDLRLSIDRKSKLFKSTYALRTECERYNSRFKNSGQERVWVRNIKSVSNLNTLAHIALLAVAFSAISSSNSNISYRMIKTSKRIA